MPDSVGYLHSGGRAWALIWGEKGLSSDYLRSPIYCAGLYLLHRDTSCWPVVALNAVLVSWVLWLLTRSLFTPPRRIVVFGSLIVLLSVLTTLPWYVCLLSGDVLGGALYLAMYLLIFCRELLRGWERISLGAATCWMIWAHPTHLVLAVGLTFLLAVFAAFRSRLLRGCGQPLLRVAALVVVAAGVQVGVNARVFGHATLMGPNVPFLMARIVADGPSHSFLEDYCGELHWTLCRSVHKLPWYEEDFLWAPDGIWQSASPQDKAELQAEEIPLLLGTLRTHPLRQFKRSSRNFLMELTAGGIADASYDNPWMIANLDNFHPGTTAAYLAARPRFNGLPRRLLRHLQEGVAAIAAALCLALLPWVWRKGNERLLGLETVVSFVVLANAFLTGVTSGQDARYEGRIIWLLPMLAFLLVGCLLQARWDKKIGSPPSLADVS